jgi:hypothetical protein
MGKPGVLVDRASWTSSLETAMHGSSLPYLHREANSLVELTSGGRWLRLVNSLDTSPRVRVKQLCGIRDMQAS